MQQSAITWPEGFVPGFTDNFCTNEAIVADLNAEDIWPLLITPSIWPSYYANSSNSGIRVSDKKTLELGSKFYFETFGITVECVVTEYVPPGNNQAGRISWHGWTGKKEDNTDLEALHGWIVEDLDQGRVRILTQETQNGSVAKDLASQVPNPMINGHQAWLDGIVKAARAKKQ